VLATALGFGFTVVPAAHGEVIDPGQMGDKRSFSVLEPDGPAVLTAQEQAAVAEKLAEAVSLGIVSPTDAKWMGWDSNQGWTQVNSPPLSLTLVAFLYRVGVRGSPVAADTVEFKDGPHYNKHPKGKLIGHWIVGHGYKLNGLVLQWTDPGVPFPFADGEKQFDHNAASFVQFLKSNGIAF
jgi:hypothetical protein